MHLLSGSSDVNMTDIETSDGPKFKCMEIILESNREVKQSLSKSDICQTENETQKQLILE